MHKRVDQQKLGELLRTFKAKGLIGAKPKEEKIRPDFERTVKGIKELFYGYYIYGFDLEDPASEKQYSIAIAKEFVKGTYEIMDVETEEDVMSYNWAHRQGFDEPWEENASWIIPYTFGRLFDKIRKDAPNRKEEFYAVQNIFDECYYFGRGLLADVIFLAMDANPEADLELLRKDIVDYVRLTEMTEGVYGDFDIAGVIGTKKESSMKRALMEKVSEFEQADEERKEEAWGYLKHFGYRRLDK